MRIVVTGARGFIGRNLCSMLREQGYTDLVEVGRDTSQELLSKELADADFIYHLAGINRPNNDSEFQANADLTHFITQQLASNDTPPPLVISSSIQAAADNAYGKSKRRAEEFVIEYGSTSGARYYIYRLPNVFGKWCKPNYNSFVATFCHSIINDMEISIDDPHAPITLVYIDDVCKSLVSLIDNPLDNGYQAVMPEYQTTVGEVADLLQRFKMSRSTLITENVGSGLTRALYSTFLSYMPPSKFCYKIPSYGDERGVFSEILKTSQSGQFSFFTALPGVTRGGHYHHTKNEKFLVVKGKALFKFEHIDTGERFELYTNSDELQIVETVPGWSHNITNVSDEEIIVLLWANEVFDRDNPDTFIRPL